MKLVDDIGILKTNKLEDDIGLFENNPEFSIGRLASQTGRQAIQGVVDVSRGLTGLEETLVPKREPVELNPGGYLAQARARSDAATRDDPYRARREQAVAGLGGRIAEAIPKPLEGSPGGVGGLVEQAIGGAARFAPSMVTTAISPPAGLAATFTQVYGGELDKYEQKGIDKERANTAALFSALGQTPIEYAGNLLQINALGKIVQGISKPAIRRLAIFGKSLLQAAVGEGAEEYLQTYPEAIADIYAENPGVSPKRIAKLTLDKITSPEFQKQAGQQALVGATAGTLLAGAGGIASAPVSQKSGTQQETAIEDAGVKEALKADLEAGNVTPEELNAVKQASPELANDIDAALAEFSAQKETAEPTTISPQNQKLFDDIGIMPEAGIQPKSAEESAKVLEQAPEPPLTAREAAQTFIKQGTTDEQARRRNQNIIKAYEDARDLGVEGKPLFDLEGLTAQQAEEIKQIYEDGLEVRNETRNFVNQEGPAYAERSGKPFTPVGEEIKQEREATPQARGNAEAGNGSVRVRDNAEALQLEAGGKRLVHTMPDGSTMEGPEHVGAVPGSERNAPKGKSDVIESEFRGVPRKQTKVYLEKTDEKLYTPEVSIANGRISVRYSPDTPGSIKPKSGEGRLWINRKIDEALAPLGKDIYFRSTKNEKDIEYLKGGRHRGSKNWRDNIDEGGLSVAASPEFPEKYAYFVKGEVIGEGTDREPLLNIETASAVSDLMPFDKAQKIYDKKLNEALSRNGLTREQYRFAQANPLFIEEETTQGQQDIPNAPSSIAEQYNKENEAQVSYDGEQNRDAIRKPPLHSFTFQSGPLKGRSFNLETPSIEGIQAKVDELAQQTERVKERPAAKSQKATERAWTGSQWKPILDKYEFKRGKNKGKFRVTFNGGRKRIVDADAIKTTESIKSRIKKTPGSEEGSSQLLTDVVNIFAKKQTETPEFKKWFGDSKVVDDKGRPLVVYHGTTEDFDVFDKRKSKDFGIHFGDSDQASEFANKSYGRTIPVYLSIKNPIELDFDPTVVDPNSDYHVEGKYHQELLKRIAYEMGHNDIYQLYRDGNKNAIAVVDAAEKADELARELSDNDDLRELFGNGKVKKFHGALGKFISSEGYDGVIYENEIEGSGGVSYSVFEPTQIKSSIGNAGVFDPNNPSIIGSSELINDIAYHGAKLIRDGVESFRKFRSQMRQKFSDVWDKIKGHMRELWNVLNNERREIKIERSTDERTQELIDRYTKDIKKQEQKTTDLDNMDLSEFENTKDIWFGDKDVRILENKNEASKLQDEIKTALGINRYNAKARQMDSAIQIYIDTKRNPDDIKTYYNQLTDAQKKLVDLSQNLPDEIKGIADKISESYTEIGLEALDAGVIRNVLDNYAARAWDLGGRQASENLRKFGTKTRHAKQRKFATIIEGWANGFDLKIKGATNNLHILKDEIIKTIQDKKFLGTLLKLKDMSGTPLVTTKHLDGYTEIKHPNFVKWEPVGKAKEGKTGEIKWYGKNSFADENGNVWERKPIYAQDKISKNLNNILGTSALNKIPGIHVTTKYNAIMKSWILQSSFFHHLAFMRSYYLGTNHKKWSELNIRKAYKQGEESIRKMEPLVKHAVKNGLTLGVRQDWQEGLLQEKTAIGKILDKTNAARAIKDKILMLREMQADFLFNRFGSGLKMKAFEIEYRNYLKKHPNEDPNVAAKRVARLINDDFGGLHLGRMGRNPTTQHIFRIFALAPDWTESNIRTMVKSIKSGSKEETAMYRKFWAGILIKGAAATIAANFMLAGGDPDDFWKKYKKAWKSGHFRWMDIDITPVYKMLGGKTKEHKYFSLLGHFKDPTKFIVHPVRSAHHKGSVVYKTIHEALTGVNWAGQKFTTAKELYEDRELTKYGAASPLGYEQLPSYIISQIIGSQPVQVQNALRWASGEMEAFDAITNSLGLGVRTTYSPKNKIDFSSMDDKAVSELENLGISFNLPHRKIKLSRNVSIELDEDVYRKYADQFSDELSKRFEKLMSRKFWGKLSEQDKIDRLRKLRRQVGERYMIRLRHEALKQRRKQI